MNTCQVSVALLVLAAILVCDVNAGMRGRFMHGRRRFHYWSRYQSKPSCDCNELMTSCENSNLARTVPACFSATSCSAQGNLADRLRSNIDENDRDDNELVTGLEFYEDLRQNYDTNGDNCVNREEWVNRWTSFFKFSTEYAEGRYLGNDSLPCPIDVISFQTAPIEMALDDFVNANIQTLVDVCQGNPELLTTNCDCAQLVYTCESDDDFKTLESCINVVAAWKDGTFSVPSN